MNRRQWIVVMGLGFGLGCSVEVDGQDTGLSAGGGPGTAGDGATAAATAASDGTADGSGDGLATSTSGDGSESASNGTTGSADATGSDGVATDDASDSGSGGSTGDGFPGDPLHPDLDVPNRGEACTTPGSLSRCPALEVCRFHTTEQGRCESCDACGNLGAPCTEGTDCDILFACFQGTCTNICPLGTFACGPVEDCLDVGHPTHGVCRP